MMTFRGKLTLLLCGIIGFLTAGALLLIFTTEPTATRSGATRTTPMLVDVTKAESGTWRPVLHATGTVVPEREINLGPRVGGAILEVAETFTPGAVVEKGERLLQIDPADYETALKSRRSDLREAEAELDLELGRQIVAEKDYAMLEDDLSAENRQRVLRQPQLNIARSRVEASEAALRRAELDLERTTIRAPFDALILSRDVNLGSLVSPGDLLGHLLGIRSYWVETTLALSKLSWIQFAEKGRAEGSRAQIRNRSSWPEGVVREGRMDRFIGALDDRTRMARLLVRVEDPLALDEASKDLPELVAGSYVEVAIEGRPLAESIRLERDLLRMNDTVWVMKDGTLEIREVEVILRDRDHAYIGSGLEAGERVVVTNLATVVEGAPLRLDGDDS
ncbi:MAG: efflux RND transporter periplasmic adaptor subunit [Oceanipulchritudo sp.]